MVLGELVTASPTLNKLLDTPLKATIAFRIGKLSKEIAPHIETFEQIRNELLEKYGDKQEVEAKEGAENQISYTFKNGSAEKFQKELVEMLDEKVDSLKIRKIKLKDLEKAGLTARELMSLEWLIAS